MIIGICDDEAAIRNRITRICEQVLRQTDSLFEILEFEDGEQFLSYEGTVDLLVLDIEMPKRNGLEVKEYLQYLGGKTMIIFVTNHEELVFSAFGLQVFGLVLKDQLEEQFGAMLQTAVRMMNQYVLVDGVVDSRNILFIRSERVYSNLILADGSSRLVRTSLADLEQQLLQVGFIRCHRTYLINAKWVDRFNGKTVEIQGNEVPVSIRKLAEVREKYRKYCEKNARYC